MPEKIRKQKKKEALGAMEKIVYVCLTCGHVGCTANAGKHSKYHWKATGHPLRFTPHPGASASLQVW